MKERLPLVSIIVPCYKSAAFINRPVESILAQTYDNWELILVDDCSPDNTYEILCEIAKKDARIHVYQSDKNNGKAAPNFNIALGHANGDFVQILGHDDRLSPDALEKMVARHMETGADIILPDAVFFFEDAPQKNWTMAGVVEQFGRDNKVVDHSVILTGRQAVIKSLDWSIHAWAMVRADICKKYKFCESGMNGDEYSAREFFLAADKVAFCDAKYYYYQEKGSITKKLSPRIFDIWDASKRLEQLLIDNKFPKKIIRKFNRSRFNNYCYLVECFERNRDAMSADDVKKSQKNVALYKRSLTIYKTFFDRIFRKEKIGLERIIVLFDIIKVKYTKHI